MPFPFIARCLKLATFITSLSIGQFAQAQGREPIDVFTFDYDEFQLLYTFLGGDPTKDLGYEPRLKWSKTGNPFKDKKENDRILAEHLAAVNRVFEGFTPDTLKLSFPPQPITLRDYDFKTKDYRFCFTRTWGEYPGAGGEKSYEIAFYRGGSGGYECNMKQEDMRHPGLPAPGNIISRSNYEILIFASDDDAERFHDFVEQNGLDAKVTCGGPFHLNRRALHIVCTLTSVEMSSKGQKLVTIFYNGKGQSAGGELHVAKLPWKQ